MDCHATACAVSRNDRQGALCEKVDSSVESLAVDLLKKLRLRLVLWLSVSLLNSRIFELKMAFCVFFEEPCSRLDFRAKNGACSFVFSAEDSKILELESRLCEFCGAKSLAVGFG